MKEEGNVVEIVESDGLRCIRGDERGVVPSRIHDSLVGFGVGGCRPICRHDRFGNPCDGSVAREWDARELVQNAVHYCVSPRLSVKLVVEED